MIPVMNKLDFKKQLLKAAIQKQQFLIDDFRERIKDMQEGEEKVNEGEYDIQDRASNDAANRMINKLADELVFANKEMATLIDLLGEGTLHSEVDLGSVVVTDKKTFYISASLEKLQFDGNEAYGVSIESPLFQLMKGKKKGQSVTFNHVKYVIRDVF